MSPSREENRRRALAGVHAIFERYGWLSETSCLLLYCYIVSHCIDRITTQILITAMSSKNPPAPSLSFSNISTTTICQYSTISASLNTIANTHARYNLVKARVGPAFDNATMENCEVLDASVGPPLDDIPRVAAGTRPTPDAGVKASCTTKLFIGAELGNYNGVMHGGAAGVIFDMLTTIALGPVARPGFWS